MPATAVRGQKLANELARMADRLEGKFRQAFLRSMLTVADDPELKKLIKEIQAGRFVFGDPIDSRLESVRINLAEMNEVARQAIAGSAKVTKDVLNLKGSFDVVNDSVLTAARNLSVDLSTYLRKSTRESLRQVIEDLIGGNISEAEAVRRIKLEVGLLPQHTKAVNNYRKTLLNTGTPRGKANQLAEQYTKRLLKYRANMIARTEVARATGIGQTEFWRQMRDQGALPAQANRVWITAMDERACDFCRSMDGQVATIDGGWDTPNGYMEYPQASHPHCRCSSGIVMSKPTKTGQMGRVAKLDEIEFDQWVSKHLGGQHNQQNHSGGKRAKLNIDRYGKNNEYAEVSSFELDGVRYSVSRGGDAVGRSGYNGYLVAYAPDGQKAGYFDYNADSSTKTASVAMVETDPQFKRKGIAEALLDSFLVENPEYELSAGYTTEDGAKWWRSVTGGDGPIKGERISKHLGGRHNQQNHARGRGMEFAASSGNPAKTKTAKKPKVESASSRKKGKLVLGVDYDEEGYPLDTEGGVVAEKLSEIHGLYDEASSRAMAIAERGVAKLLMPRDKDGLPQVLKLKDAEKRYGDTPDAVVEHVQKNFGVRLNVTGGNRDTEHTLDILHGVAQAIEEANMNGIKVKDMTTRVDIDMRFSNSSTMGHWSYSDRSIAVFGGRMQTGSGQMGKPITDPAWHFNADVPFRSVGYKHGEGAVRMAYGTFIHELGHAMDNYVGRQIQETRKKIIDDVFEGTGLIRSDWASTYRGQSILYNYRDVNATTYYGDLGAQGLVRTNRYGAIDTEARSAGMVGRQVSFSEYATYNLRENLAETFTAYWLYGGSKGKYKQYYNRYIERVGNIIDMSQGIIKVMYPINENVIETNVLLLPADHPLIVWFTGVIPIA